jgi:hypothetical protein
MIGRVWVFAMGIPGTSKRQASFLERIAGLGVTDVALMLNQNNETSFGLPVARARATEAVARGLRGLGVATHLVTWLRPDERYVAAAAAQLRPLCVSTGARSLMFDVEEPWTRAPGNSEANARAFLSRHWPFGGWPCLLGATGIAIIPPSVRPVAELYDYVLPQAYSAHFKVPAHDPGVTQPLAHRQWKGLRKPIVMGLAGWNDLNRPGGISETEAMQRALVATEDLRDPAVGEVAYWVLEGLRGPREDFVKGATRKARAGLSQRTGTPGPAPFPLPPAPPRPPVPATRATLRSGARGPAVRDLQTRLNRAGLRLAVDGIFGRLTAGAVRAFQGSRGLAVDGIVGPATWRQLSTV